MARAGLVILLFCFFRIAQADPVLCESALKNSYFLLPAKGQQLVIGVLVETLDDRRVLGLADYYWGGHQLIYHNLIDKYPVARILWAGELLIENPDNTEGLGKIVFSISTSGFLWERMQKEGDDRNDRRELKRTLERRPDLITPYTQHFSYSAEHAHLDPLFQELHQRTRADPTDTVRHRFRNILHITMTLTQYLTHKSVSGDEEIKVIHRMSEQTINDIIAFMDSHTTYSRRRHGGTRIFSGELKYLRRNGLQNKSDYITLIDLLKTIGPRVDLANEEPEVLVFGTEEPAA